MSTKRWVLRCKECRAEYIYAEIATEGIASYFMPKKPEVPPNFTHTCPICGHQDSYRRSDLVYEDDETAPSRATAKCADRVATKPKAKGKGA
jgi:rRNA maturation endonuclease Nob1